MAQDWFAANAPSESGDDWFASNAPSIDPIAPVASHGEDAPAPTKIRSIKDLRNHPGFKQMKAASDERMQNMPAAAAMTAAFLSGGASLPLQAIAAGGGGYLGARGMGQSREDAAATGILQGTLEGVGGGVGKGLAFAAPKLMRGLLKIPKALRESFGGDEIVKTLLDEGAPITERGAAKMAEKVAGSREAAMGLVKRAEDLGDPGVQAKEIVPAYRKVVTELRRRADIGQPSELTKVGERGRAIVKTANRTAGIPLTRAQALKETAQDAASGAYRKLNRGMSGQLSADDLLDEATAKGLRQAIEGRVPGVAVQNQQTQRLLGGLRALEDAIERSANNNAIGGMRDLIAIGGGAGIGSLTGNTEAGSTAGLLMALLSRPGIGSRAAIGMNRAAQAPLANIIRSLLAVSHEAGEAERSK